MSTQAEGRDGRALFPSLPTPLEDLLCKCEWALSGGGLGDRDLGQLLSSPRRQDHRASGNTGPVPGLARNYRYASSGPMAGGGVGSIIYPLEVGTRHRSCPCLSALDWLGPRGGYESGGRLPHSWRDGLEEALGLQTEVGPLCSDCASEILRNPEEQFSPQQPRDLI